ncbi:MAG: D-alanyl-D-alanine carboxypeptidase family protein [Bradymonadia bacterium]
MHMHFKMACLALFLTACGTETDSGVGSAEGPEEQPPAAESAGHDHELDPDLLADLESKADSNPCERHGSGDLDGDDLLTWVNKDEHQRLKADYAPVDLMALGQRYVMPGRSAKLRQGAWLAFIELADDAFAEEGFDLRVRSGYRSYRTQCITFDYKVRQNGFEHAFRYSAQPGRSQHQLGTTADITTPSVNWALTSELFSTTEGMWLAANAWKYGFALSYPDGKEEITGYAFEPWHFRYIGRPAVEEMQATGDILETYLERCAADDPELVCPRAPTPEVELNRGFIGGACEAVSDCHLIESAEAQCITLDAEGAGEDDVAEDEAAEDKAVGMCSQSCERFCPDMAGAHTATVCIAQGDGKGMCHSRCDYGLFPMKGCREGLTCKDAFRPNGDGPFKACLLD